MKKKEIFRGVGTALVTPFRDGEIDYPALDALIEGQIAAGIDCLVIGGTTGEAATLTDGERYALYEHAIERIAGRTKVILGAGTNDTRIALEHTRRASALGCDGILVVTPYYNKGTDEGLLLHYTKIAEASTVPVMLYNVPPRTGVNLPLPVAGELAKHENVVAIKEASDSAERLAAVAAIPGLALYAGNDAAILPALSLGGRGVISVASNLFPAETKRITDGFFAKDLGAATAAQIALLPLVRALFTETSPSPVKYAMQTAGLCTEEVRLPLTPPREETKRIVREAIAAFLRSKT